MCTRHIDSIASQGIPVTHIVAVNIIWHHSTLEYSTRIARPYVKAQYKPRHDMAWHDMTLDAAPH